MSKKNPILSNAEKYTQPVARTSPPPGDKKMPYSFAIARQRVAKKLGKTISSAMTLEKEASPDDQIVTALTLHPSFLAKSFYPKDILKKYSLKNVGSKEVFISPDVAVSDEQRAGKISSSLFFVSGKKESFIKLLGDLNEDRMDALSKDDLVKIEDISFFDSEEKLTPSSKLNVSSNELCYEIVLHAASSDRGIIDNLFTYIAHLGGSVFSEKTRSINGLTFCFVKIKTSEIEKLARFTFVRVVRPLPEIKLSERMTKFDVDVERDIHGSRSKAVDGRRSTIAIFDGGLFQESSDNLHIRYFDLTNKPTDALKNYTHGSRVTSAVVYGEAEDYELEGNVVLPVDHYKVYSSVDQLDIGLVDVLDRIQNVLKKNHYKFVNISLGPEYPCSDSEPSLWTSTLDQLAEDGDMLIAVAVGNAGKAGGEFSRIQPPSDLLNGLSIGAANSKDKKWGKSSYSNNGPGRRPGYVKPDALFFGGEEGDDTPKIQLIRLDNFESEGVYGTSYATPLVIRQAALIDYYTGGKLNVSTIRALLIHSTGKHKLEKKDCGWGRIEKDIQNILFCTDKKVTFIYQGTLETSSGVRAALPCPKAMAGVDGKVTVEATICFYAEIDPQHTVSYTKAGIEVTFRPDFHRFDYIKETGKYSAEAKTRSLFNKKNILGTEQTLRKDNHKWETCYKVYDRMLVSSLSEPIFDIRYLTRDEGHPLTAREMKNLKPLRYSLIVTVELDKDFDLYTEIINEYDLLTPITINLDVNAAP